MSQKFYPFLNSFSSGVWSEAVSDRTDLQDYNNSCSEISNFFVKPQGGVVSRPGSSFIAATKYDDYPCILAEYTFSDLQNYILEIGHLYIRFHTESGRIEIPSGAELILNGTFATNLDNWSNLSYGVGTAVSDSWGGGTALLTALDVPDSAGVIEQSFTTTVGSLYIVSFTVYNAISLRIGTTSGGEDLYLEKSFASLSPTTAETHTVFFTATSTTTFIRFSRYTHTSGAGDGRIDNVSVRLSVPYEIATTYNYYDLDLLRLKQSGTNLYIVNPLYSPAILYRTGGHASWYWGYIEFIDGPYEDEVNTPTLTPSGSTGTITLTASAALFLSGHVGALWRLRHGSAVGYCVITAVTSSTVATALVKKTLGGTSEATGHSEGAWSNVNGFPRTIAFHNQRIIYASSPEASETIWASKVWNFSDFTPGTLDDAAYTIRVADAQNIRWLASYRNIIAGAKNDIFMLASGSIAGLITPTSPPKIDPLALVGGSKLDAVKAIKGILYVNESLTNIFDTSYSYEIDSFSALDITIKADHLFKDGIRSVIFTNSPFQQVWTLRLDGKLAVATYDKTNKIIAWTEHSVDGSVEDIAKINVAKKSIVYAVIKRTINNITKRYIECFNSDYVLDSSVSYIGVPKDTFGGLSHLNGKTVKIIADGTVRPDAVVPPSGVITIGSPASNVTVGLGVISRLITHSPEISVQNVGSAHSSKKWWNYIAVGVIKTSGIQINGKQHFTRTPADKMDTAPALITGMLEVENVGWDVAGRITIENRLPLKAEITSISGSLVVGGN